MRGRRGGGRKEGDAGWGSIVAEMTVNKAAFLEDCSPSFLTLPLHVVTLAELLRTFPVGENSPTKIEETSIEEALYIISD